MTWTQRSGGSTSRCDAAGCVWVCGCACEWMCGGRGEGRDEAVPLHLGVVQAMLAFSLPQGGVCPPVVARCIARAVYSLFPTCGSPPRTPTPQGGIRLSSMWDVYCHTWLPFGGLLTDMEAVGMAVDRAHLAAAQQQAEGDQREAQDRFRCVGGKGGAGWGASWLGWGSSASRGVTNGPSARQFGYGKLVLKCWAVWPKTNANPTLLTASSHAPHCLPPGAGPLLGCRMLAT